ncbi:MAG: hypothetical protein IH988_07765 [Planctomycetes bacterium]|nr:hypothetical protein [Planctomycetota bacterium]
MLLADSRAVPPTIWRRILYAILELVAIFCVYLIARWSGARDQMAIPIGFAVVLIIHLFRWTVKSVKEDMLTQSPEEEEEVRREKGN